MLQYATPWALMSVSLLYLPLTTFKLILAGDTRTLFSWPAFREAWYGNFWAWRGPKVRADAERIVVPLLEGRLWNGCVDRAGTCPPRPIHGVVLEIGAGSGAWTEVLAKITHNAKKTTSSNGVVAAPSKIFGVEPNPILAASLQLRVKEVGLEDTYEVLPVGTEDLTIDRGSVDCIVTVQCLCSILELEKNVRLLYNYLKKGGRWYVYEHVKAEHGLFTPAFQWFTNIFWEYLMGSCHLCRQTGKTIRDVGPWKEVDLWAPADETGPKVVPHIFGILTK